MKSYKIIEVGNGKKNIEYYLNDVLITTELYSQPGFTADIWPGYENKNAPDWLNLEKSLRYSALFAKAFSLAKTDTAVAVGMNLFMITLVNGKSGESTENGLKFAFDNLGITWEEKEKDQLNQILEYNKFTTRV